METVEVIIETMEKKHNKAIVKRMRELKSQQRNLGRRLFLDLENNLYSNTELMNRIDKFYTSFKKTEEKVSDLLNKQHQNINEN